MGTLEIKYLIGNGIGWTASASHKILSRKLQVPSHDDAVTTAVKKKET